jgi:hypothetical protein
MIPVLRATKENKTFCFMRILGKPFPFMLMKSGASGVKFYI